MVFLSRLDLQPDADLDEDKIAAIQDQMECYSHAAYQAQQQAHQHRSAVALLQPLNCLHQVLPPVQ